MLADEPPLTGEPPVPTAVADLLPLAPLYELPDLVLDTPEEVAHEFGLLPDDAPDADEPERLFD